MIRITLEKLATIYHQPLLNSLRLLIAIKIINRSIYLGFNYQKLVKSFTRNYIIIILPFQIF